MLLPTFGIHCHFFRQNLYDRLPARRVTICFTLCLTQTWPCHIMFHTSLGVLPFRTAFSPLPQISVGLLLLSLVEHPVATVYIMASQDLISQFSPDSNAIPATQPDRSRTPRRPHHAWHQTGTDVSWPYALCNDDPSSFLASSWRTSSTTNDLILLNAPPVDPADTAFSTYTTDLFTATSRPRKPDTSTTHPHSEIAETYVITWRKSSNSRRLHLSSHRNPTSGTMETGRRFS